MPFLPLIFKFAPFIVGVVSKVIKPSSAAPLLAVVPHAVELAEKFIQPDSPLQSSGDAKREFVLEFVEKLYDSYGAKILPDLPHFDERAWFLGCARVTLEEAVKALKAKAAA